VAGQRMYVGNEIGPGRKGAGMARFMSTNPPLFLFFSAMDPQLCSRHSSAPKNLHNIHVENSHETT
jgi:hypothetical protein